MSGFSQPAEVTVRASNSASVRQSGALSGLQGVASFAAVQWPSKKDEDRVNVSGPIPGLCDAVVQLYDGHGGKLAARHCVDHLVPSIEEAFFEFPSTQRFIDQREQLALQVGEDGFHQLVDSAVRIAFERMDEEVKRVSTSGTTAVVLLLKRTRGGDVAIKCAWCGDSRAVLVRDFDTARVLDLSVDHKPESAAEQNRIQQHYISIHGPNSFLTRAASLESLDRDSRRFSLDEGGGDLSQSGGGPNSSRRRGVSPSASEQGSVHGSGKFERIARESGSGSGRDGSRSGRGALGSGAKRGGGGAVAIGMLSVEVTMGHADFVDDLWGISDPLSSAGRDESGRGGSGRGGNGPGGSGRHEMAALLALRGADAAAKSARRAPSRFGSHASGEDFTDDSARHDAVIGGATDDDVFAEVSVDFVDDSARHDPHIDVLELPLGGMKSEDASAQVQTRVPRRSSFVGFFRDDKGKALSKERLFSSSGESHGVSRSIGDRGAARGCIATPDIKTVMVPAGRGARIAVCSDGVWDVYDSDKAVAAVKGSSTAEAAAKKLCSYARQRREYGGQPMDDISAIIIDIGEKDSKATRVSSGGFFSMCRGLPRVEY